MENFQDEIVAKLLLLGDSRVGKTSILNRFSDGFWSQNTVTTLGTLLSLPFFIISQESTIK